MFENNTDRMFWTIAVLILGATLLMIGNKAFPKAQESIMTTISQNIETANNASNKLNDSQSDSNITKQANFDELKNYDYDYNSDGTINIVKYNGSSKNINVPKWGPNKNSNNVEKAVKVTTINRSNQNPGPFHNKDINTLSLPNTITSIGYGSFTNNNLTSINLPESLTFIGESAFNTNNLSSVEIPNSVTNIKGWAFWNNKIKSVSVSNSVQEIARSAFERNQISSVSIPKSVTTLATNAFDSTTQINRT